MGTKTYHRGVRDAKIAAWLGENSFSSPAYDIKGIRNATLTWVVEEGQLEGDDGIEDQFTNIISATLQWEQAAVDLEVLDMISGGTMVSNASYEDLVIGRETDAVPYVAFAGSVFASDANTVLQFLLPKAKISGDINFQAQFAQYLLPGAQFRGVKEGETNGILRFRKYHALTALEIPLRDATGGF